MTDPCNHKPIWDRLDEQGREIRELSKVMAVLIANDQQTNQRIDRILTTQEQRMAELRAYIEVQHQRLETSLGAMTTAVTELTKAQAKLDGALSFGRWAAPSGAALVAIVVLFGSARLAGVI